MIKKYSELKGVIKVGDEVRAVAGKFNPCEQLKNDGSNIRKITAIDDDGFKINGCWHPFDRKEKTNLAYEKFMLQKYGPKVVQELREKRTQTRQFSVPELEDYCLDLLTEPSCENLKAGDVLERNGDKIKVLGVCGEVFFTSLANDFEKASYSVFTKKELQEKGFQLANSKPEIVELTMDEIAKKFEVPVENLKIRKE